MAVVSNVQMRLGDILKGAKGYNAVGFDEDTRRLFLSLAGIVVARTAWVLPSEFEMPEGNRVDIRHLWLEHSPQLCLAHEPAILVA